MKQDIVHLDRIIQDIRTRGVEEAKKEAQAILESAREQATSIVRQAENEAGTIVSAANARIRAMDTATRHDLNLAFRDTVLSATRFLEEQLLSIFQDRLASVLSGDLLFQTVNHLVRTWAEHRLDGESLRIDLPEQIRKDLLDGMMGELGAEVRDGLSVRLHPDLKKGFVLHIGEEGYEDDFSENAVAEALFEYLSPKIRAFLKPETKES